MTALFALVAVPLIVASAPIVPQMAIIAAMAIAPLMAIVTSAPRLLNSEEAAKYLGGISVWTLRALVANGEITPVRLPSCRRPNESSRRLLFAREDLDALIDRWKA